MDAPPDHPAPARASSSPYRIFDRLFRGFEAPAEDAAAAERVADRRRVLEIVLLTLCHAMGAFDPAFGDPDDCKAGPLTGVSV